MRWTIVASDTLASFGTRYTKLEAFTIAFIASRAFASAAFPMLKFVLAHCQFLNKRIRISFRNICFGGRYVSFTASFIETLRAAAFRLAKFSPREALAVEFEALRFVTIALVR